MTLVALCQRLGFRPMWTKAHVVKVVVNGDTYDVVRMSEDPGVVYLHLED